MLMAYLLKVYFFRERERVGERETDTQRKRERENLKQALHCAELDVGLDPTILS